MNKWLERALVSVGAALVSTTAIVTTAERPGKRKKRKKKKGEDGRGKDGALVDDEVPRSIGAQAAHDYRVGHDGGITTRQFLENVRDASKSAARRVSTVGGYLFGKQEPPLPGEGEGEGELEAAPRAKPQAKRTRKKVRRRVRRDVREGARPSPGAAKKRRKAGSVRRERGDFDELRDEAVKRAASAAAKHAADKTGLGEAAQKLKESGGELWKKTEKLGKAVKERVPEDLGERATTTLNEAGKGIARGARALSERLRQALSEEQRTSSAPGAANAPHEPRAPSDVIDVDAGAEDAEAGAANDAANDAGNDAAPTSERPRTEMSRPEAPGNGERLGAAFKDLARWMEGPGAPRDDDERPRGQGRVRRATSEEAVDAAFARDPSEPAPDVVEAKDPPEPPPDIVEPKDPPEGP